MAKKKKIREEFDTIFKSGNEKAIKKMLDKYPWLLSEVSSEMEKDMGEQQKVIAALGVMEDELGGTVPVDEVIFSLKVDFNAHLTEEDVLSVLKEVEELGLVKRDENGWILTREGGKICDDYLNKNLENYS
jgi:Ca2+-binding EF-hand superfamily protein